MIVKIYSDSGKPLVIREEDGTRIAPEEEKNKSTFTIPDIAKDITATLAYAKTFKVTEAFNSDVVPESGYFESFPTQGFGEIKEGRTTTVIIGTVPGYDILKVVCDGKTVEGSTIELKNVIKDIVVTAHYKFYDYPLKGVFTVADDGNGTVRKVRFARGNLWHQYGKLQNEKEQYQFSSSWAADGHISHFYWKYDIYGSISANYNVDNVYYLFTNDSEDQTKPNADLSVCGQKGCWRVLTGGDNGEWKYLINKDNEYGQNVRSGKYKLGVTVCDHTNCLILLPDDWEWNKSTVGSGWQEGGYPQTSIDGRVTWMAMEDAGAVCLPAAGHRIKNNISGISTYCYYWSSCRQSYYYSYNLYCHGGSNSINPNDKKGLDDGEAIRLVTDVK